jgi:hypothetical protein
VSNYVILYELLRRYDTKVIVNFTERGGGDGRTFIAMEWQARNSVGHKKLAVVVSANDT